MNVADILVSEGLAARQVRGLFNVCRVHDYESVSIMGFLTTNLNFCLLG